MTREEKFIYYMTKCAGELDEKALASFGEKIRPGDIVNFEPKLKDKLGDSVSKGAVSGVISGTIGKMTGSPESHTAMVHSVDPKTGKIKIIHNYEQGDVKKIQIADLDDFAHDTTFRAYRPKGVSAEQGQQAVDNAVASMNRNVAYPKGNLLAMGPQELLKSKLPDSKVTQATKRLTGAVTNLQNKNCDPATGVCSYLPVHSYRGILGEDDLEVANAMGANLNKKHRYSRSIPSAMSPGDYRRAGQEGLMDILGEYNPKNLDPSIGHALKRRLKGVVGKLKKNIR